MKQSHHFLRSLAMNSIQTTLLRSVATLLVAMLLAGCSIPSEPPAPVVPDDTATDAATPAGDLNVLPTPLPETPPAPPAEGTPTSPPEVEESWTQESFGNAWTIGYPAEWKVSTAGAHEGALQVEGNYEGHTYSVTYSYPIGILAQTLEAWVDETLLPLSLQQREQVVVSDVMVNNTPAKKVLNVPTADGSTVAHYVYIWRNEEKNPRLITITQAGDQPVDAVAMDQLLDRLLITVQ